MYNFIILKGYAVLHALFYLVKIIKVEFIYLFKTVSKVSNLYEDDISMKIWLLISSLLI